MAHHMKPNAERRFIPAAELRIASAAENDGEGMIDGYAALFNVDSEDLGGFVERIAPGAFAEALAGADVRALFNHDPNFVIGRTKSGTLSLGEDARGLHMRATPPAAQWASDLMVSIKRGDISQMSFAFMVGEDVWEKKNDVIYRTITKVAELLDVSPVTYPAYPDTTVAARSLGEWKAKSDSPIIAPAGFLERSRRQLVQAMRR